ncbi:hypothetical protein PUV54_03070 [Hyphococcus flavus]|uniref:Peptidase M10 metallopeptidase domain-containing protein n=1 Tax=Hyphococcus flavus TaxID=1866326 RepID=A0AAF0CHQ5_9PROT|nr:hypothetical protein [Hyphococcus flavus]WDI32172.1 hypothetical protein PUV54_03070 [Hyphococcus flavus]
MITKLAKTSALASFLLAGASMPTLAQSEGSASDYPLTMLNDCSTECGFPEFADADEAAAYLQSRFLNNGEGGAPSGAGGSPGGAGGPSGIGLGLGLGLNAPQVVYLDFQPGEPTYTFSLFGITLTLNDYFYTDEDKEIVKSRIAADYAPYNFEFVLEEPTEGDYVTLQFNSNDAPCAGTAGVCPSGGILFGSAGEIDFGNDNRSIVAINDANLWPFLNALDPILGRPAGTFIEDNALIDVIGARTDGPDAVTADEAARIAVLNQTSNTGAHELGHGLGLRHYDAWGPIGGGLPSTGTPEPASFAPVYDGPADGDETVLHIMSSGASSGLPLSQAANADRFHSERSAIKLAINERGRFVTDEQANSGQAKLKKLQVVNPILEGENADGRIDVRNIVVEGRLDELDEVDTLTFSGKAGQVFNAELISNVESFFFPEWDSMIGKLTLYKQESNGSLTEVATNDAEFESFDAFLLDAVLPENGTYVLHAEAPNEIFLGFDAMGDPIILPLSDFGFTDELEYRTGQYILNAYIVESKNGNGPKKIGGPKK